MQQPSAGLDGILYRHEHFTSRHIPPRHVDVWCPPGYGCASDRYPVIYMHDGQNLFDSALASSGVDWGMDVSVTRLMREKVIGGALVVGIWNTAHRRREYMPQQPLMTPQGTALRHQFEQTHGGPPVSDAYLRFVVEEVKPSIDATYRTMPDREQTFMMGSSMGGLISLYAVCRYSRVFGGAGCLSTHWPIGESLVLEYLGHALPPPGSHKIYFDYGTGTLDAGYEPHQQQMDALMITAGYEHGENWMTQKFVGAEHSERAWRARVHIPLRFLLAERV
jgi:predicted alpha/beta superfamily hydrolase